MRSTLRILDLTTDKNMQRYTDKDADYPDASFFDNLSEDLGAFHSDCNQYLVASHKLLCEVLPAAKVFKPHHDKMKVCKWTN